MELDKATIKEEGKKAKEIAKPWIETPIDFGKIRGVAEKTIAIFSDNDRYVPLEQKMLFEKELGAEIVVEKHKGHFTASEGIKMLPSALNSVLGL
jgi:predicted alpha/beta hydrolase family esterase